jgi:hypothetical protein
MAVAPLDIQQILYLYTTFIINVNTNRVIVGKLDFFRPQLDSSLPGRPTANH